MSDPRVLVIGAGSIGERHLRCFQKTGRVQLAVCEINDTLRGQVASRYGIDRAYRSLEQALNDPPEAAVICTPANLHIPMALQLAQAGAHLLIEKPLSTSANGIAELHALAEQQQLTIGVAYVLRMHPALAALREAIAGGRFGVPLELVITSGQHFPYYRPAYRDTYYTDRATGGGAIQDALTHLINAGEWITGPLTELAADADHQVLSGVTVEDTVHVIGRHGRLQASYSLNQHQAANETTITVVCEQGTARCELHHNRWRWVTHPAEPWHDEPQGALERDDLFVRQAESFLSAVQEKSAPACTLGEAAHTLAVNLAILAASESRSWQRVADHIED